MAHSYDSFEVSTNDETAPLIQKPRATRKARPSRCCKYCCICFLSILAILVLACGILAILLSIDLGKSPPQAGTSLDSPGVGFDLTAEYATAAIRDKDDTSTSVASIPYDGDMVEMMQRMSSKKQ